MKIAVVAPSCPVDPMIPQRIDALVPADIAIDFHPQCFLSHGHFAGTDQERLEALVAVANDPRIDAVWFGRGGYGAARIAISALDRFGPNARDKLWLGYSDAGFILAGLAVRGFGKIAHGPMPSDLNRDGGEVAVKRALDWFANPVSAPRPQMAFNMTVLSNLLGTPLEPDFEGKVLMLEEVDEHHYRLDRMLFHITSSPNVRRAAGLMLGRCAPIPENDRAFLADAGCGPFPDEERIARHWCEVSGIPFLGRADIGHDANNIVVPFGA